MEDHGIAVIETKPPSRIERCEVEALQRSIADDKQEIRSARLECASCETRQPSPEIATGAGHKANPGKARWKRRELCALEPRGNQEFGNPSLDAHQRLWVWFSGGDCCECGGHSICKLDARGRHE